MKVRFGLLAKFTMFFILCAAFIIGIINNRCNHFIDKTIMEKYVSMANQVSSVVSRMLDGDDIERYYETKQVDETYDFYISELEQIKEIYEVSYLYVFRFEEDENICYLMDIVLPGEEERQEKVFELQSYEKETYESALQIFKTGQIPTQLEIAKSEIYGYLASAYLPIYNSENEIVALVGVDIDMNDIISEKNEVILTVTNWIIAVVASCFVILLLVVQLTIIRPIKRLETNVKKMGEHQFGIQTPVVGHNEISEISYVFNQMSKSIEGHFKEINAVNEAYYKFVPSKIFQILNKSKITDVNLGDQNNTELAVMYMYTDKFSETIIGMDNEKIFTFINQILYDCIPVVMEQGGIIESIEEAGLTVYYTQRYELAINGAVMILKALSKRNESNYFISGKDVTIRFGIAYGAIKLGIVGHHERVTALAISEQRFISEFLYRIGEKYNSHIIVTANTVNQIPKFHEKFHSRVLGLMYLSSNQSLEKLYDVYEGDSTYDFDMKNDTVEMFEEGVNLFCAKQFYEARLLFVDILKVYRKDHAAREYLSLCNQYIQEKDDSNINIWIETM